MKIALAVVALLVASPSQACRLVWAYADYAHEPDAFLIILNERKRPVAEAAGNARSIDCALWAKGRRRGQVKVAAEYGRQDTDYYQYAESPPIPFELDPDTNEVILIDAPFDVRIVNPVED